MFNVAGADGDAHLYLAVCFNESCIRSRKAQESLRDQIYPFGYGAHQGLATIQLQVAGNTSPTLFSNSPVQLPVELPLRDSEDYDAGEYLRRRNFDPMELSRIWGAYYSSNSPDSSPRVVDRIVIPVYGLRTDIVTKRIVTFLAGWQAREVNTSRGSNAKYLTMKGMRKSQLLYGLPQAVNTTGPVVVVEGVTDVWRLGSNAVAVFGKSISPQQRAMLISRFPGRPIVIVFDRDAGDAARSAAETVRQYRRECHDSTQVLVGHPPEGAEDVGEASREAAWASIHRTVMAVQPNLVPAETADSMAPLILGCTQQFSANPQDGVAGVTANPRSPSVADRRSSDDSPDWEVVI